MSSTGPQTLFFPIWTCQGGVYGFSGHIESPAPPPCTLGPLGSTIRGLNASPEVLWRPFRSPGAWRAGPAGQLRRPLLPQLPGLARRGCQGRVPHARRLLGPPDLLSGLGKPAAPSTRSKRCSPLGRLSSAFVDPPPPQTDGLSQSMRVSGSVCTDARLPHARAVRCQFEQRSQDVTGIGRAQPGGVR